MPQTAPAALARIFLVRGFNPRISATENIMVMSLISTQGATFPEAIVETITLGRPYGKARITLVLRVVPCVPPSEMIP